MAREYEARAKKLADDKQRDRGRMRRVDRAPGGAEA
jgi:hypothetical protein